MRPLAVDLVLLRSTAPDLPLVVGRVLAARVVERNGRHGIINLAGAYLTAELPDEVQVGDRLRLVVQRAQGEQVLFALAHEPPPLPTPAEPPRAAGAPHEPVVAVARDPGESGEDGRPHAVSVRFEGEALGAVELRVVLDEAFVHARVALAEGPPLELARAHAGALRVALGAAATRPAEVEIVARPKPVDVYG
ncbi:MAG TPA: hypothetical protein VN635_06230 [Conexibacter sp.]|nr:hypothetical protein [Conexibacter sp.]